MRLFVWAFALLIVGVSASEAQMTDPRFPDIIDGGRDDFGGTWTFSTSSYSVGDRTFTRNGTASITRSGREQYRARIITHIVESHDIDTLQVVYQRCRGQARSIRLTMVCELDGEALDIEPDRFELTLRTLESMQGTTGSSNVTFTSLYRR